MASGIANLLRGGLDPSIWKACAGGSVQIPTVDSRVYYFPQGHAEQASSPPDFNSIVCPKPMVLCRILSVRFLANPDTDEVFARIRLEPVDPVHRFRPAGIHCMGVSDGEEEEKKVLSFAKILTPSDANNGGGFSVPRFCADSIFPPLDYKADPPVQNIDVIDVHGVVWEFRHIYRGTPRRHLLTTGWSKFVNQKKLVAGDSVVFMRNRSGEIFVGIRRTARVSGSFDCMRWNSQYASGASMGVKVEEEFGNGEGFRRTGKGKVSPESVLEAAELAGEGKPFEIVYYPRAGSPDFVVNADIVEESLQKFWTAGVRVKMAVETEDSSRMTWFQGTVSLPPVQEPAPWFRSSWRMLQVTWDEPEVLQNVKKVSPWQVELIATTPPLQTPFPPTKRLRVPQNLDLLTDGERSLYYPMEELTNSMMGNLSPSLFSYNSFPAGMQGARQESYYVSSLSNFVSNSSHRMYTDHLHGNMAPKSSESTEFDHLHGNMAPKSSVSTELNIGSTSQSDNSSPHSQSSVHFFATELFNNRKCSSTTKSGVASFQLFGKLIQTNQPVERGFDDVGCSVDDGCKVYKESEGINNPMNPSSCSSNKLYNGLDVPCKQVSTVEACLL
ncbi:auxin response factor 17-like [Macadamia integrifolia]|uniref:auxin response factor 17-like n=1 Tax=Macadamia integrifolia TaxID=60698 RepID=UPI001C4E8CDD|nr:auxin response factor 17-like [Macadamia integrifolia]